MVAKPKPKPKPVTEYLVASSRVDGLEQGATVTVPDALLPLMPTLGGLIVAGHLVKVV